MSRKSKEQVVEQVVEQTAEVAVLEDVTTDYVIKQIEGFVPSIYAEDGNRLTVKVGEQEIKSDEVAKVVVTTRTIAKFNAISSVMGAIDMGAVDKEQAKKEGFTTVYRMFENAIPSLSDSRIREMYTVGRIFGDVTTHKWKAPIPEKATITNLSCIAKKLNLGKKIDEATAEDIANRFNLFCDKCLNIAEPIDLAGTLADVRKAIDNILKDDNAIKTTYTEVGKGEQDGQQEQKQDRTTDDVREALNLLYTYFAGNSKAVEYVSLLLAELPKEQEQEQEQENSEQ